MPDDQVYLDGGLVDADAQNSVPSKDSGTKRMSPNPHFLRLWGENLLKHLQKRGPRLGPAAYRKYKMRARSWCRFPDPSFSKLVLRLLEKSKPAVIRCQTPFQPLERHGFNSAKVFQDRLAHLQTENLALRCV